MFESELMQELELDSSQSIHFLLFLFFLHISDFMELRPMFTRIRCL